MRLAIFDLDHTLIPFDSDKSWNQYLIDIGVADAGVYQEANDRFYQDYLEEKLDIREYSRFASSVLREHPLEQVLQWREGYLRDVVHPQIQPRALECVESYKAEGFFTLIISATNTFVIEPIAALHGVDHFLGCELEVADGRYTGELVGIPTYREGKVDALKEWLTSQALTPEVIHFYSDSINDRPLLEYADQAFVVDPDHALAAVARDQGWPVIQFSD